jgi:hypothetical protein
MNIPDLTHSGHTELDIRNFYGESNEQEYFISLCKDIAQCNLT